jgi:hypothetical protein
MPSNLDMLKVALQEIEQTPDERRPPDAEAELKNILIERIASFKLVRAIESLNETEPADTEMVYSSKKVDDQKDHEEID